MARRGRKAKLGGIDLAAVGHSQAKPELSEIDNPLYNRAHDGETWNPKKIMGVKNMKESALVVLEQRRLIDRELSEREATDFRRMRQNRMRVLGRKGGPKQVIKCVSGQGRPVAQGMRQHRTKLLCQKGGREPLRQRIPIERLP